ncbi:MAG: (d)CMP kinase [Myxococcaceae bacterium]|nr:(d)CMP kinase [Myxococcaceae bacterium]
MQLVRAAAAQAAASDHRLGQARVTLGPPTEGGNNFVAKLRCHGGDFYAKVRANPFDDARRERWALTQLGPRLAPALVHSTGVREVLQRLAARGDFAALRAADVYGGAVLLLEAVPGHRREHLDERDLAAVARALARLHQVKVRRGPPLPGGATAYAMLQFMKTALDAVASARLIGARTRRGLAAALRDGHRHVESRWWGLDGVRRTLCHGDLRPANLLFFRGEARLIDFEHAGLADPMADLSRFAVFSGLSSSQELCLLDAYAEAMGVVELERYFAYRPLTPVFAAVAGARYLLHVLEGDQRVAPRGWVKRRIARVERELSQVLGEPVRLTPRRERKKVHPVVVAVDGLAGSGKTPLAAALARRLGVRHLNTGALYRAAALLALEHGLKVNVAGDEAKLVRLLRRTRLGLTGDGAVEVEGQRLQESLDVLAVEETVAQWAARPAVRAALARRLERAVRVDAAVIEGRDVQTRLRPDAALSVFVEARPGERAEVAGRRAGAQRAQLLRAFSRRDHLDVTRAAAPVRAAVGALRLRSVVPLDAAVDRVLRRLERG